MIPKIRKTLASYVAKGWAEGSGLKKAEGDLQTAQESLGVGDAARASEAVHRATKYLTAMAAEGLSDLRRRLGL
jgi:hypothetical protein